MVLPFESRAMIVMLNAEPAVCVPIVEMLNFATATALTVIPVWDPVIEGVAVSVAVIDWAPIVFRVTPLVKTWMPLSEAWNT